MEYNKNAPRHLKSLITTPVLEVLFKARKLDRQDFDARCKQDVRAA